VVEWGITTSAANISEEIVATVSETFILGQELLLIEREIALEGGYESTGNRPQFHLSGIRNAGETHRQDSLINFHCFWGGNEEAGRGQSIIWLDQGLRDGRIVIRFPIRASGFHPY
jgi:hypothetical protein